jgi:hypothetical protein
LNASLFDSLRANQLTWFPELGLGWYPVAAQPYDSAYWARYRGLDRTPAGDALTAMRRDLVADFWGGPLVDIGIGGGRFVEERDGTAGFDVNPSAIDWLKTRGAWCDPYQHQVDAVSFWDSLEHIHDPAPLLRNVRRFVFVSLPVFDGPEDVLRSKHFRRDEHCWYFTPWGLRLFMAGFGFHCMHHDEREQSAGREGIGTFVFLRT